MTAPTAAWLRELRWHHAGCSDRCPDARLLAALDHVATVLEAHIPAGGEEDCGDIRDLLAYIAAPATQAREPGGAT